MRFSQAPRRLANYEATNRSLGSGGVDVRRIGDGRSWCGYRSSGRRLWARGDGRPRVLGAQSLVPGRFPVPPDPEPRASTGDVGYERLPHLLSRCPGPGQPRSRYLRRPQSSSAADSSTPRAVSAAASGDMLEHVDPRPLPWRLTTPSSAGSRSRQAAR